MKGRAAVSEDEMRRAAERFRGLKRLARRLRPREPIDPTLLEEIRQGAEPFRRALELARCIGHHSRKPRDMR